MWMCISVCLELPGKNPREFWDATWIWMDYRFLYAAAQSEVFVQDQERPTSRRWAVAHQDCWAIPMEVCHSFGQSVLQHRTCYDRSRVCATSGSPSAITRGLNHTSLGKTGHDSFGNASLLSLVCCGRFGKTKPASALYQPGQSRKDWSRAIYICVFLFT